MHFQTSIDRLNANISDLTKQRDAAAGKRQTLIDSLNKELAAVVKERDDLVAILAASTTVAQAEAAVAAAQAERDAAVALHAECPTQLAEKDNVISAQDAEIVTVTAARDLALEQRDAALTTIDVRDATIATRDASIVTHLATIDARDATIADLLAQLQPHTFKIFNEYRSTSSLPNMPQIKVVYESELIAPGDTDQDPPDPAFIDDLYDELIAAGNTWIVTDNESWSNQLNYVITAETNMANYLVLAERAALKGLKYSQYGYPYRSSGFISGSGDINVPGTENYDRKQAFFNNVIGTQALTDLMTGGLTPSFYFLPAVIASTTKMRRWIDVYVELWQLVAPDKKMIPFVWPRVHGQGDTWIDGPMYRVTLDKIKEQCSSMTLWARAQQGADPDPRTIVPVPAWYLEHEDFIAVHGLTA